MLFLELNTTHYPKNAPFPTWLKSQTFLDPDFVAHHHLSVLACAFPESTNFCITAPDSFAQNCPTLLKEDSTFLRHPDELSNVYGLWGHLFLTPDYQGIYWLPDSYGWDSSWIAYRYAQNQEALLAPIKDTALKSYLQSQGTELINLSVETLWQAYPYKDTIKQRTFAQTVKALKSRILENGTPRYPEDLRPQERNRYAS